MAMRPRGMQVQMTAYDVLGVSRAATDDEIKLAFKRLAKIYHPDRVAPLDDGWRDPWPDRVIRMASDARDMLLDPQKRAAYDEYLAAAAQAQQQPQPQPQPQGAEGPEIVPRNPPRVNPFVNALRGLSQFIDPAIFVDFTAEQMKEWLERNVNKPR